MISLVMPHLKQELILEPAQVPVDYCAVRYVKKPAGAKPGMVIFSNQHTLYVKPEQQCVTEE